MCRNLLLRLLALPVVLIFSNSDCTSRRPDFVSIEFRFEVPITFLPGKDTITLGDTIWVDALVPDTVREVNLNKYYKLDTKYLEASLVFRRLTDPNKTVSEQISNALKYKVIPHTGTLSTPTATFQRFNLSEAGTQRTLKFALIPLEKGVHFITFLSYFGPGGQRPRLEYIDMGTNATGQKRVALLSNVMYNINNGGIGFSIFKQHCKAISETMTFVDNVYYEQKSAYTFVVK